MPKSAEKIKDELCKPVLRWEHILVEVLFIFSFAGLEILKHYLG